LNFAALLDGQIASYSLMAGQVSNRHLIQVIHRPASETLTPVTKAVTCSRRMARAPRAVRY